MEKVKIDIIKTEQSNFDALLNELDKKDLIKVLSGLKKELEQDYESFTFEFEPTIPFERIRRITGYLVGTTDRWNNGKQDELKDRVKHG